MLPNQNNNFVNELAIDDTTSSCALVVCSCDAYQDLWQPYFSLLFANWPDCPFRIYLVSNNTKFNHPNVTTLLTGADYSWGYQLKVALNQLNVDYIFLTLEDFFLRSPVETKEILTALTLIRNLNGNMLRVVPMPPPNKALLNFPDIGYINPGAQYRVSTQAAIWRRSELFEILSDDESIWEFELKGSRRSDTREGYYSYFRCIFPYKHHVIERGKWFRNEAIFFGKLNINCDFKKRKIMTIMEMTKWRVTRKLSNFLNIFPVNIDTKIRRFLRYFL
jgi:hypothetical protein